jgi:hypothetical protein
MEGGMDMRIRSGFMMRRIAGVDVVVPAGEGSIDFNGIITLSETAAFLFEKLREETCEEELLSRLLCEYEVDEQEARADIREFLKKLEEAQLLA